MNNRSGMELSALLGVQAEKKRVSEARVLSVKSGDVFKNPHDGSRIVVERIDRSDGAPMVYASEHAPSGGGLRHEKRILGRSVQNFKTHADVQGMEKIDPIQDREPVFYEAYEKQMEVLGNAFSREFFACEKALDEWEASLKGEGQTIDIALQQIRLLRERMDEIADKWEETDDRFVRSGRERLALLSELRDFSRKRMAGELLEEKNKAFMELEKEYGSDEPDVLLVERGYFRGVLHDKVARLLGKCRRVKSGKMEISDKIASLAGFEREIKRLNESITGYESQDVDAESAVIEIKGVLDALDGMDRDAFRTGADDDESGDGTYSREKTSARRKKMRMNEGEGNKKRRKNPVNKNRPDGDSGGQIISGDGNMPMEDVSAAEEASVKNGIENGNGKENPQVDFEYLLADMAAPIYTEIYNAKNREDISFISFRALEDGMRVFVEMTKENGLKEIYRQLIATDRKQDAFQMKKRWIEENHRLETEYLKKKLLVEILAVGAEMMERIDKALDSEALRSIGRIVWNRDTSEHIFIPNNPGVSENDPSGTEGIRSAIQNMIGAWRDGRVSDQKKWKNFEDYFQKEFSSLIADSNKQIRKFWEEKRAKFPKESRKEKSGPVKRVRKEQRGRPVSTELADPESLKKDAMRSAERYFTDEAIPAIEQTLGEAGVDLIWLLSEGESNQQVLDFVLQEIGVNIVTLVAGYTGQLSPENRTVFEQKIRTDAKNLLMERVMEKVSRMLESRSPEVAVA